MSAGRSRGRAKLPTRSDLPTPASSSSQVPLPSLEAHVIPPARIPSPARIQPETGRGRGFSQPEQTIGASSTLTTTASSTTGTASTAGGNVSPSGADSGSGSNSDETSPPQQHSPPHSASLGRAALRGGPHQPAPGLRADIIEPMERLALQQSGDVRPQVERRDIPFESVLYTRPANCESKVGTFGTPIKLLCNYFEIMSQPNWVLYQYHVEYMPVVESKKLRIALLASHENLFPKNKAFDGSTLYSLTKLPDLVIYSQLFD